MKVTAKYAFRARAYGALLAGTLSILCAPVSRAADYSTIFYLDEHQRPVTRLDRLPDLNEGLRAILAMYTIQAGGGCEGYDSVGFKCVLTRRLNLGAQCSAEHQALVLSWFKQELPQVADYPPERLSEARRRNDLESVCYNQPSTATFPEYLAADAGTDRGRRGDS